jgi:uncharacterized protein YigA (DUF484 family)
MDMVRNGNDNLMLADKLLRWARTLLLAQDARSMPELICREIRTQFSVPQVGIKVWGVAASHAEASFTQGVSEDARVFASSLTEPFCGVNTGFEAVNWLEDPNAVTSLALLPLREGPVNGTTPAFGMLVLASPDAQRYNSAMGTDFLARIAELASAALSRLR